MTFLRRQGTMLKTMLISLTCFLCSSYAHDDLLLCKPARSVFSNSGEGGIPIADLPIAQGRDGKRGQKGEPGIGGVIGRQGQKGNAGTVDYGRVEQYINDQGRTFASCSAIKDNKRNAPNGLYDIKDDKGSIYRTYCDMSTGGGEWTLVASVHEDFLQGKCTVGDRWSSEHGNNAQHPHGDGAWENTRLFGEPEAAASDDYKNQGYFNMAARDVMIWQVPNDTPMNEYKDRAFMMYHTTSGFLSSYGRNLHQLFKVHYPLRDRVYARTSGNGPAPAIVWDKGSNDVMVQNTPPNCRVETTPGYIQFRAINNERGAFAMCPGVKINPGRANVEHVCIGGTSNHAESYKVCGDFAWKDYSGYGTGTSWSANLKMTESVVMIFYR